MKAKRVSHPLPSDAQQMRFSRLLRLAMDYGLGRLPEKGHYFATWTEEELSEVLENEFEKRFGTRRESRSKDNTLAGWLHRGNRPRSENLTVLIAILTDQQRIEHSDEWRRMLVEKAREKSQSLPPDTAPTSIFPRGSAWDEIPISLHAFFRTSFNTESTDHLRRHLSADHALDLFERSVWSRLPDTPSDEQALHLLLARSFWSSVFEYSLAQFLTDEDDDRVFGRFDRKTVTYTLNTCSEPIAAEHLLKPETHCSALALAELLPSEDADAVMHRFPSAFFRELYRNSGFYLNNLRGILEGGENQTQAINRLQLHLHQAGIELENRKSLFSSGKIGTGEPLSLCDIYVDLPCVSLAEWEGNLFAFDDATRFTSCHEIVEDFCKEGWNSPDITDRVLVLRGDPGSGKSSVLKAVSWKARKFARFENTAVLFVPFQNALHFSDQPGLHLSTGALLGFSYASEPIDILDFVRQAGYSRLLVFFDGLDELGSINAHETQVRRFAEVIGQLVDPANSFPCKFVVSGRDQAFRPTEFELDLFNSSYRLVGLHQARIEPVRYDPVIENKDISSYFDLRDDWLDGYCRYKSLGGNIVTRENLQESYRGLDELTSEPLLLFLLSKLAFILANRHKGVSFDLAGVFDLSHPGGITKNDIYSLLIASIRIPQHRDKSAIDRPFREGGLPDGKDFERVLSCMALPTWQNGTGRRGTVRDFFEVASERGLAEQARRFTTAAEEGDTKLIDPEHLSLMSVFYFDAQRGQGDEGDEYEFTHKSFASYLVAREIFASALNLVWAYQEGDETARHSAFADWIDLTTNGYEEPEILRFINIEVDRYYHPEGERFLNDLGRIGETAKDIRSRAVTVEIDDFRTPFEYFNLHGLKLVTNQVEALELPQPDKVFNRSLVILFAIWTAFARGVQRSADEAYDLDLEDQEGTLRKLAAPIEATELDVLYNVEAETSYFSESLSGLNLEGYDFSGLNLINAQLVNSNISHVHIQLSVLDWGQLEGCLAEGLTFISCQLQHLRVFHTNGFTLVNSVMRLGLVEFCKFDGLLFAKSEMTGTRFLNCRFTECEFDMMSFADCVFENCAFVGCTFELCNFDEASLAVVAFKDCSFEYCSANDVEIGKNVKTNGEIGFSISN